MNKQNKQLYSSHFTRFTELIHNVITHGKEKHLKAVDTIGNYSK